MSRQVTVVCPIDLSAASILSIIQLSFIIYLLGLDSMSQIFLGSHHNHHLEALLSLSTLLLLLSLLFVKRFHKDQSSALSYLFFILLLSVLVFLSHLSVIIYLPMSLIVSSLLSPLNFPPTLYTSKLKLILSASECFSIFSQSVNLKLNILLSVFLLNSLKCRIPLLMLYNVIIKPVHSARSLSDFLILHSLCLIFSQFLQLVSI